MPFDRILSELGALASRLWSEDDAQTSIEYALICGIVAIAGISALTRIRLQIVDIFSAIQDAISSAPVGDAG
ncbi:MAG: Flp family type IVb pilin [Deltaproteobacteria bacterium]|nr:Flp family type IVb pilin [Deltaproteobacteria bacterium]